MFRLHAQESDSLAEGTGEDHLEVLRRALLELCGKEMAELLVEDQLLRNVMPVIDAIVKICSDKASLLETARLEGLPREGRTGSDSTSKMPTTSAPTIGARHTHPALAVSSRPSLLSSGPHTGCQQPLMEIEIRPRTAIPYAAGGRLPPLTFAKYTLGEDFNAYMRNFKAIAEACGASHLYMVNQLKCQMVGDAKELLEARLPEDAHSWPEVKAIAVSLFVDVDVEHAAWDFLYNTKYHWGDNLEVHYSKFIRQAKFATSDQAEFMLKTARTHFIRSLPQDLMREAGLRSIPSNAEMLRHLKRCMQFSRQPKKMVAALNAFVDGNPDDVVEELSAVTTALQAYGWQKPGAPPAKSGKPFVKFNCSLCDQPGHNSMTCPLRPFLLDALPQFKQQLAAKQAKEAQAAAVVPQPLN